MGFLIFPGTLIIALDNDDSSTIIVWLVINLTAYLSSAVGNVMAIMILYRKIQNQVKEMTSIGKWRKSSGDNLPSEQEKNSKGSSVISSYDESNDNEEEV